MADPSQMQALLLKHDGFSNAASSSYLLENIDDYLTLTQTPIPKPAADQVLIRMRMACVNPSDVMFVQGSYGQPRVKGAAAGFEGVGDIVAVGDGGDDALIGTRVSFAPGLTGTGTWAEYALADAATVIPLRPDLRDEDAAALIVNPLTAAAMVELVPEGGAFIATAAASQLGKLMAGLAAASGRRLIAIARRDAPLDALRELGAAQALNETSDSFAGDLAAAVRAEKPTILLDAVAGPATSQVFNAMGAGSRWVIYGKLSGDLPEILEPGKMIFLNHRIEGFWLVNWMRETPAPEKVRAIAAVQARFASGDWRTDVSANLTLDDVIADLPGALAVPDGKVMISFGASSGENT